VIGFGDLCDDPFDIGWGIELSYYIGHDSIRQRLHDSLATFSLQFAHERFGFSEVTPSPRVLQNTF